MPRPVSVTYRVWPTAEALAAAAAEYFASVVSEAVEARGVARVAISGGTTPKAMFALLADRSRPTFAQVPWERLHLFWVDERCVPPTDKDSNYRMASEAMLQHVPLPASQIHRIEGELDPENAAARYEATIRAAFRLEGRDIPDETDRRGQPCAAERDMADHADVACDQLWTRCGVPDRGRGEGAGGAGCVPRSIRSGGEACAVDPSGER